MPHSSKGFNLSDTAAPVKAWQYVGLSAISFSQLSLVNWAAGGENSYSLAGLVSLFGKYIKMIYDHDIKITDKHGKTGPRTQFKEVLSVGLSSAF